MRLIFRNKKVVLIAEDFRELEQGFVDNGYTAMLNEAAMGQLTALFNGEGEVINMISGVIPNYGYIRIPVKDADGTIEVMKLRVSQALGKTVEEHDERHERLYQAEQQKALERFEAERFGQYRVRLDIKVWYDDNEQDKRVVNRVITANSAKDAYDTLCQMINEDANAQIRSPKTIQFFQLPEWDNKKDTKITFLEN
ncbi:MAG: hypothetical protein QM280_00375 [Bacteroidota bacterium]|jgi:hypothetical protein|nr:hypothetical protein [Bacteroidota bacterium]